MLTVHKLSVLPDTKGECPFAVEADIRFGSDNAPSGNKRGRGRRIGGAHIAPWTPEHSLAGMFAVTVDGKSIISVGHWDGSIRCQTIIDPGRPRQVSIPSHKF